MKQLLISLILFTTSILSAQVNIYLTPWNMDADYNIQFVEYKNFADVIFHTHYNSDNNVRWTKYKMNANVIVREVKHSRNAIKVYVCRNGKAIETVKQKNNFKKYFLK